MNTAINLVNFGSLRPANDSFIPPDDFYYSCYGRVPLVDIDTYQKVYPGDTQWLNQSKPEWKGKCIMKGSRFVMWEPWIGGFLNKEPRIYVFVKKYFRRYFHNIPFFPRRYETKNKYSTNLDKIFRRIAMKLNVDVEMIRRRFYPEISRCETSYEIFINGRCWDISKESFFVIRGMHTQLTKLQKLES